MIRLGVVTATVPGLTVTLDGTTVAVNSLRLGTYTPTVGDRVATTQVGSQLLTLGTVA